jgi:hypothetical protein
VITELDRAWLSFTGKERLDYGNLLPQNTFNAFFVAAPSSAAARTAVVPTKFPPATAATLKTAAAGGNTGQFYLLAGSTVLAPLATSPVEDVGFGLSVGFKTAGSFDLHQ